MMHRPVIRSLLETDLYKLTMLQAMLHAHPAARAEYEFVCRNEPAYPLATLAADVRAQIEALEGLRFTPEELAWLAKLRFLKSDFIDFLSVFHLQRRFVRVETGGERLRIVASGPQVHVMLFEIYVLAIVNELYFERLARADTLEEGRRRLAARVAALRAFGTEPARRFPFEFFDFGLRRRFSGVWQEEVVGTLAREVPEFFKGTSNIDLARRLALVPIGTMAHEWLQTYQGLPVQLRLFQNAALEAWVQEYRGDLGIALTDTVGMDAFLADFDLYFAKLFDGLRHDSGDPFAWAEKAIAHYRKLRIDPSTKRLVFSDGLDIEPALALYRRFSSESMMGFGIGTRLTNDLGIPALNIVMKLVRVNGVPVAKLSDSPGKTLATDPTFLAYLKQVFNRA